MVREAREIAKEYPGIELWETNIDAMCMWLVKNPQDYGVLVAHATCSATSSPTSPRNSSAASASPPPATSATTYAVFEPTHGSAPKYAGQNKVNPIATILAARLMLDYLGETR